MVILLLVLHRGILVRGRRVLVLVLVKRRKEVLSVDLELRDPSDRSRDAARSIVLHTVGHPRLQ